MRSTTNIGILRLVTLDELECWRAVWIDEGGLELEIPLAAFIRRPHLLALDAQRALVESRRSEERGGGAAVHSKDCDR